MARNTIEYRIHKDANGFYLAQMRFLPVLEEERCQNDGWRTCYITQVLEHIPDIYGKEVK